MTYTKPEWIPVTTELNDPLERDKDYLHHEDWCEDNTCLHRERP